jgi:hypothetical protein
MNTKTKTSALDLFFLYIHIYYDKKCLFLTSITFSSICFYFWGIFSYSKKRALHLLQSMIWNPFQSVCWCARVTSSLSVLRNEWRVRLLLSTLTRVHTSLSLSPSLQWHHCYWLRFLIASTNVCGFTLLIDYVDCEHAALHILMIMQTQTYTKQIPREEKNCSIRSNSKSSLSHPSTT